MTSKYIIICCGIAKNTLSVKNGKDFNRYLVLHYGSVHYSEFDSIHLNVNSIPKYMYFGNMWMVHQFSLVKTNSENIKCSIIGLLH